MEKTISNIQSSSVRRGIFAAPTPTESTARINMTGPQITMELEEVTTETKVDNSVNLYALCLSILCDLDVEEAFERAWCSIRSHHIII